MAPHPALQQAFDQSADAPTSRRPLILYVLGDDEPTRGDSHGYAGIGRTMAEKLGARFFQIDEDTLSTLYPEIPGNYERERMFLQEHGPADIVICRSIRSTGIFTDNNTIVIENRNENIGTDLNKDMLVAHHLTADVLAAEGRKLRAHYQDEIKGALIAFILVENIADRALLAQSLVQNARKEADKSGHATIFMASCWRTSYEDYEKIYAQCLKEIHKQNVQDRVTLLDYHLNERKNDPQTYNPYIGLLDQADHIILWGKSFSIYSEAAFTGKTVHVGCFGYDRESAEIQAAQSNIRAYNFELPELVTTKGPPIDKTGRIADELIQNCRYRLRQKNMWPPILDTNLDAPSKAANNQNDSAPAKEQGPAKPQAPAPKL